MNKDKMKEIYKSNHDTIFELLQNAAVCGDVELCKLLLDRIYPDFMCKSDMRRRNLLHLSVYHKSICELLFDYIEEHKIRNRLVCYQNDFNDTPLMEAIAYHQVETVKVFLDRMTKEEILYCNNDGDDARWVSDDEGTSEISKLIENKLITLT
jgi:ankyrin repeat protein